MRSHPRWPLALVVLAASLAGSAQARASEIRDTAGMFDADAVRQAKKVLDRVEHEYDVPVLIETIDTLPGNPTESAEKNKVVDSLAVQRDREHGNKGIYILMAKDSRVMSHVVVPGWLARHVTEPRRL